MVILVSESVTFMLRARSSHSSYLWPLVSIAVNVLHTSHSLTHSLSLHVYVKPSHWLYVIEFFIEFSFAYYFYCINTVGEICLIKCFYWFVHTVHTSSYFASYLIFSVSYFLCRLRLVDFYSIRFFSPFFPIYLLLYLRRN